MRQWEVRFQLTVPIVLFIRPLRPIRPYAIPRTPHAALQPHYIPACFTLSCWSALSRHFGGLGSRFVTDDGKIILQIILAHGCRDTGLVQSSQ